MKFQNGYNLIYEKKVDGENGLYATKAGIPGNDDAKIEFTEGDKTAKLIYEKTIDGVTNLYASESGIPGGSDSIVSVSINGEVVLGDDKPQPVEENVITIVNNSAVATISLGYEVDKETVYVLSVDPNTSGTIQVDTDTDYRVYYEDTTADKLEASFAGKYQDADLEITCIVNDGQICAPGGSEFDFDWNFDEEDFGTITVADVSNE